jgi:hypothetical protein
MRRDSSDGNSTIIDLDSGQIIEIDNTKRSYTVLTFDQMRQRLEAGKATMQAQMAKQNTGGAQQPSLKITPQVSATEGTGTRTVAGVATHELKLNIDMLMQGTDPNTNQSGQINTWVKSDQYVASSIPGAEQKLEFEKAMAKELDWLPGEIFGSNPQVSSGMDELRKNSAAHGFPMLQYISIGMGAPGQPSGATTNASSTQAPRQQEATPVDLRSPSAAAAQTLKGMFGGFHHKKKTEQSDNETDASAPPSQPGSLMEMTVEVTSLSTDPLDPSLFAPPAGYQHFQAPGELMKKQP